MKTYILMLLALLFALPYMAEARSRYYSDSYYDSYYDRGYGYYDRDEDYGYYDDGYYDDYRPRRVVHHKKKAVKHKKAKAKIVKAKIKKAKKVVVNKPVIKESAPIEAKAAPVEMKPVESVKVEENKKSDLVSIDPAEKHEQIAKAEIEKTDGLQKILDFPKYFTGTGKRSFGGWGNPTYKLNAGKCKIVFDCPAGRMTVNDHNFGGIVCGEKNTGKSSEWKRRDYIGTINMTKDWDKGMFTPYHLSNAAAGVPKMFPMLKTTPSICGACYIHQYVTTKYHPQFGGKNPYVSNPRSAGCIGVSAEAWEQLNQCGGSKFALIPKGFSAKQKTQIIADYEENYFPRSEDPAIASSGKSNDNTETATAKIPAILSGTSR